MMGWLDMLFGVLTNEKVLAGIVSMGGLVVACVKHVKSKRYMSAAKTATNAYVLADDTLAVLISTLATMNTPESVKLKKTIEKISESVGVEKSKLNPYVKQIKSIVEQIGCQSTGTIADATTALEAVNVFRQMRKENKL